MPQKRVSYDLNPADSCFDLAHKQLFQFLGEFHPCYRHLLLAAMLTTLTGVVVYHISFTSFPAMSLYTEKVMGSIPIGTIFLLFVHQKSEQI